MLFFHVLRLAQSLLLLSLLQLIRNLRCQCHVTATYLFLTLKIQKYVSDYFNHVQFIEVLNPTK